MRIINKTIINPAGIVIGNNARIDVPHLVASSLNMSNDDFSDAVAGGDMVFTEDPGYVTLGDGIVTNNTSDFQSAKRVYLIGRQVINNGTLLADECVVMAAGDNVIISDTDGVVGVEVAMGADWVPGGDLYQVRNDGGIMVDGGATLPDGSNPVNTAQVVLAAGDIWSTAFIRADGAGSASLTMDAAGAVGIDGDGCTQVSINAYPDYSDPDSTDAVASIDIKAGGDVAVTTNVIANAFGDREIHNAIADVTVDAGGDVTVIAKDIWGDRASIKAVAINGQENTANVLICADNVIVEAEGEFNSDVDLAYDSVASIEALAVFGDGYNLSNTADV